MEVQLQLRPLRMRKKPVCFGVVQCKTTTSGSEMVLHIPLLKVLKTFVSQVC